MAGGAAAAACVSIARYALDQLLPREFSGTVVKFTGRWAPSAGAAAIGTELIDAVLAARRRPTVLTKRSLDDGGVASNEEGESGSDAAVGVPRRQLPCEWFAGSVDFIRALIARCEELCDDRAGYWFEHALADTVATVPAADRADLRNTCISVVPNPQGSTNMVLAAI